MTPVFSIEAAGRKIYIKSVVWQLLTFNATTGLNVPIEQLTELTCNLSFGGTVPAEAIGNDFKAIAPPAPSIANRELTLYRPGQYFFSDFSIPNAINIYNYFTNHSAANTYNIYSAVTVETDEQIIY